MPTSIADLWLLTYDNRTVDIRAPLYSSRQVEREVGRANAELRDGRSDWTSIELEEAILLDQEQRCATSRPIVASAVSSAPLMRPQEKPRSRRDISLLHRQLFQIVSSREKR